MSDTDAESKDLVGPSSVEGYLPLNTIAEDPYGRRSRAWRHKACDKIVSETELLEASITYTPELNFFRRQDRLKCFMISIFGGMRDGYLKNFLGFLCFPFVLTYLGYSFMMIGWDKWKAGPPESG